MPGHIWLLHFLFLDDINADADLFCEDWNHHPLSTPGVGNLSPHDLFFLGQTSEGLDISDFDNIPVEQLHQYYGVHGARRHRLSTETGAGHPIDEQVVLDAGSGIPMDVDDSDEEDTPPEQLDPLEQLVADSIQNNIRHAPIKVQRHACPFNEDQVSSFGVLVAELLLSSLQGVEIESWDAVESIPLGRRKELHVDLGSDRWLSRARKWVLAVELFTRLTEM
ncbi:hypothetical protein FRC01_005468 [Tulasnella sp. 417]|nr:hypothetical protein FRC01_005468 [Tulasnella sp. 417]